MKIEKKIERALLKFNSFIITTHINPDGDAVGSQLLLSRLLKRLGKRVVMVNSDNVPSNLKFLPGVKSIKIFKEHRLDIDKFDALISLDVANPDRIGDMTKLIPSAKYVINIDHHLSNSNFGDLNWIGRGVSSVGEMVYGLFSKFNLKLDYKDALLSYVAIATDTGYFRHKNTSANTHRMVAKLLDKGVDSNAVYSQLFENKSLAKMRITAIVLNRIESKNGIAWASVKRADLKKSAAKSEDLEGLIDSVKTLGGIRVAILFQELKDGIIKIGFRSKDSKVDVDKLAAIFGGGGHKMASGCRVKGEISKVTEDVLTKTVKYLREGR